MLQRVVNISELVRPQLVYTGGDLEHGDAASIANDLVTGRACIKWLSTAQVLRLTQVSADALRKASGRLPKQPVSLANAS
jgi:hypothetical protein